MSAAEHLAKVASKSTATLVHRGRKSGGDTVWVATIPYLWVKGPPDGTFRLRVIG